LRRVAVEPALYLTGLRIQYTTEPAECPTIIGHRDEEAGGQSVERTYLATYQRNSASESHGPSAEHIGSFHYVIFQRGQSRVRVDIIQGAEQLLLGALIAGSSVSAYADSYCAGAAALPLSLPDGVQYALSHAIEVAPGPAQMRQLGRQRILYVLILAAAALQQ
jgi:hypothetical protein